MKIAQTVVASRNGRVVRLRDVADVSWAAAEELHLGRFNGKRAVFVTANAKDRVDVFKVRDGIYAQVDAFERAAAAEHRARARLRPDSQRESPAHAARASTSRSRLRSCC